MFVIRRQCTCIAFALRFIERNVLLTYYIKDLLVKVSTIRYFSVEK